MSRHRPRRMRLIPFKILGLLQFGRYSWLTPQPDGSFKLSFSKMAQDMHVTQRTLKDHLEWLLKYEYLKELTYEFGGATVRLETPPNLNIQYSQEREHALEVIKKQEALKAILVEVPQLGLEDE